MKRLIPFALVIAAVSCSTSPKTGSQITQAVDVTQRHVLEHTVPAKALASNDIGRVTPDLAMKDMLLALHPSPAQSAQLAKLLEDVHNPTSPSYRKWLTPEQYGKSFGPADADVKIVTDWLTASGFKVD